MWLLKKLIPDFKTIADFRKDNKKALKHVFKEFTLICKNLELFRGELVAIDGSKFKAVNSKKRNFNQAKIEKRLKEIEKKIEKYFSELEKNDQNEPSFSSLSAQELKTKIELLKKRKKEYRELQEKLQDSKETQISLTDPDSRAMVNNQKIEVCYNIQTTVDDKHKLILDYEVTNEVKDHHHLSKMSKRAKEILEIDKLEVLADKGYYNALEIKECLDHKITPYIPKPGSTVSKEINIPEPEFYESKFIYDQEKDIYVCPAGCNLTFRNKAKHHGKIMKLYKSQECKSCQIMPRCTRNKSGRIIYRWEYEEILEQMQERIKSNWEKVRKRQWLSEHPFGTIKRAFNQGYVLMKGIEKVGGEISLTMLAYNLKRVINIIRVRNLVAAMG